MTENYSDYEKLKGLIEELAATQHEAGSVAQKVGDLYKIVMDSVKLNKEGVAPIKADLEQIASSYDGVTKTYAIQAGRELRVIVGADKIDDKQIETLSADIARRIQDEMTYPGQVKITVIRETRSVSYAK